MEPRTKVRLAHEVPSARTLGKAYYKHGCGTAAWIYYYAQPPFYGDETAALTVDGRGEFAEPIAQLFAAAPSLAEACRAIRDAQSEEECGQARELCVTALERAGVG